VIIKSIHDAMRSLRGGAFADECTEKLNGVIDGVEDTGKAGRLTITIDIKKNGATMNVLAKVTDKTPEVTPDSDVYWPLDTGGLCTENPKQQKLKFEEVVVNRGTGEILSPIDRPAING
jgi:hypothetical protein